MKFTSTTTSLKGPGTILNLSASFNATAGKCTHLQTVNSQNRGELQLMRKKILTYNQIILYHQKLREQYWVVYIYKNLFIQLNIVKILKSVVLNCQILMFRKKYTQNWGCVSWWPIHYWLLPSKMIFTGQ